MSLTTIANMNNFFAENNETALEAREKALRIAFAPIVFQATRVLRETGILEAVSQHRKEGISLDDLATKVGLPLYGVRVLLESGLGIGLVLLRDEKYFLTKTGHFVLHDEFVRVNMDFVHDVCYLGLHALDKSIETGKPEGLKVFGSWPTIYEGLSQLSPEIQKSWFAFDHYYSDTSFPQAIVEVFKSEPRRLLDIGGNTGKWAMACMKYNPTVEVTIMDLPGQLDVARKKVAENHATDRVFFHPANILDEKQTFPQHFDVIWMSQFLDCFSDEEIISILKRCQPALTDDGCVYILEPFWDRQRYETAAFCLQQTSIYFTALANGNSQIYSADTFLKCIDAAGFEVVEQVEEIGLSHTLLKLKLKH